MIQHYKKQAIKRMVTGLLVIACIGLLLLFKKLGMPENALTDTCGVTLLIVGGIYYIWGCLSLCKARGYSGASILPILILSFICCMPFILFIPVVIYFGLTDKTGTR
jgi:hypothetical protein